MRRGLYWDRLRRHARHLLQAPSSWAHLERIPRHRLVDHWWSDCSLSAGRPPCILWWLE
jgi:hypothetical protein